MISSKQSLPAQLHPVPILLLGGLACWIWQCHSDSPGTASNCVGPYCDIECTIDTDCPLGSWCADGHCTTESDDNDKCRDPDNDGYCDCCDKGPDCPGGEGNPAVYPGAPELCDGMDNDCDGFLDPPACHIDEQGVDSNTPFDASGISGGITENPDGSLTLGSTNVASDFAWPSNATEGTVSRIDMIRNVEVGRYVTVLRIPGGNPADPTGIPPVPEWNTGCTQPSRTTVDLQGNAYVANRAHVGACDNHQGSVTKIGFFDEDLCSMSLDSCQCVDRNGNGTIETSHDVDNNGTISLNPADGEFLGYEDECVLWNVPIGATNSNARAMAIDQHGFIWVGDWENRKVFKLDPYDGQLVNPIDGQHPPTGDGISVEGRPYGAVIDGDGFLWYVNDYVTGDIQRIDTSNGAVSPLNTDNPTGGYGITIDRKNRVWLASWNELTEGGTVARYDPGSQIWATFNAGLSEDGWIGRGLSATAAGMAPSGAGIVWAVFHTDSGEPTYLVAFDDESGDVVERVDLADSCGADRSIGVGLGTANSVWVVNQDSDNVCRYDPDTGGATEIQIGDGPYTYSDFTGNILRSFTSPQGTYRTVVEGCPPDAIVQWSMVSWQAGTPGASSVEVRIRTADTVSALSTAETHGPAIQPPDRWFDLSSLSLTGRFLEVEITLKSDDEGFVPTLFSVTVARTCSEDPV